ncbi:ATP-binding response regulator [Palleronia abyssalis]|uniref:histidine kinase n=1 Tax=Palleronia abyssalis TaxID=1501240 RepID=A0A2R8C1A0_9RHOB|nr:ATP-binding protein [Palleronia abyssalis]SPJ26172.1 Aerobic respiration control sensor protein ArcB [Palleronia abyssalis]
MPTTLRHENLVSHLRLTRVERPFHIMAYWVTLGLVSWSYDLHWACPVLGAIALILDLLLLPLESRLLVRKTSGAFKLYTTLHAASLFFYASSLVFLLLEEAANVKLVAWLGLTATFVNCLVLRTIVQSIAIPAALASGIPIVIALHYQLGSIGVAPGISAARIASGIIVLYLGFAIALTIKLQNSFHRARGAERRAMRDRDRFFSVIAHELRTPLNGILGIGQLALSEAETSKERERGRILLSSAEDLNSLLSDILDRAKLSEGKFTIAPKVAHVGDLVHRVRGLFADRAREQGTRIEVDIDPSVPEAAVVDPLRLRQILSNLVSNAVKHTDHGTIAISVDLDAAGLLRFTVSDDGPGIPAAHLDRLFTPYAQLDDDASRSGQGTGLGLSLARDLARAMGGDLTVSSIPGVGSTFVVTIAHTPAADRVADAGNGRCRSPTRLTGLRVLVADDNKVNRLVARRMLEASGAHVIEAMDGLDTLDKLRTRPVDVLLLDLHMPRLDGWATMERIRAAPDLRDLPVIVTSAGQEDIPIGVRGSVTKPLDRMRMIDTVAGAAMAYRRSA